MLSRRRFLAGTAATATTVVAATVPALATPQRCCRHAAIQLELFPVIHKGTRHDRLRKFPGHVNPERVFVAEWMKENRRFPGVNHGSTILEHILGGGDGPRPVTQEEAWVAATVVQWLGTNCGLGFMMEAERRVARAEEAILADDDRVWWDDEERKLRRIFPSAERAET